MILKKQLLFSEVILSESKYVVSSDMLVLYCLFSCSKADIASLNPQVGMCAVCRG